MFYLGSKYVVKLTWWYRWILVSEPYDWFHLWYSAPSTCKELVLTSKGNLFTFKVQNIALSNAKQIKKENGIATSVLKQNTNLLGKPYTLFSKAIILNTEDIRTSVMSQTEGLFGLLCMCASGQFRMLEKWMEQANGDILPLLKSFQNKNSRGIPGSGPAIIMVNLHGL